MDALKRRSLYREAFNALAALKTAQACKAPHYVEARFAAQANAVLLAMDCYRIPFIDAKPHLTQRGNRWECCSADSRVYVGETLQSAYRKWKSCHGKPRYGRRLRDLQKKAASQWL